MEPQEFAEFLSWHPILPLPILGSGLLHKQQKLILYGKQKSFKSMLLQNMLMSFRYGVDWLGIDVPPEGVSSLYLQLELSHELLHERIAEMHSSFAGRHNIDPKPIHIWTEPFLKLTGTGDGIGKTSKWLETLHPDVFIIDPLYKVLDTSINEQLAMTRFFDQLDTLAARYGCAIIIVAHPRKPQPGAESDRFSSDDLMGAGLFAAWADTVLQLSRTKGDNVDARTLTFEATRYAKVDLEPLRLEFDRRTMQFTPEVPGLTI